MNLSFVGRTVFTRTLFCSSNAELSSDPIRDELGQSVQRCDSFECPSSESIREELGRSLQSCVTLLSSLSFTGLRSPEVALGLIEILSYFVMY